MAKQVTPLRRQYLQLKAQYPDAILLFRLGDFYESFDEDAKIVSQVCDVVLTSRPVAKGQRVPMAGVPYHAVDVYIAKLLQAGYRVAVADQIGDTTVNGLVPREVTRVITPGTVIEPTLLDDRRNNYLAVLVLEDRRAGLAYVDVSTGEFAVTQLEGEEVERLVAEEIERIDPAELVVPASLDKEGRVRAFVSEQLHVTPFDDWAFELDQARNVLLEHFEVATLEGFGCEGLPLAICAAGGAVAYLRETYRRGLKQIAGLSTYSTQAFMTLDPATRRNLELVEPLRGRRSKRSLLGVLDLTLTPMGARLLRQWINQPLLNLAELNGRLDALEVLYRDTATRMAVRDQLKGLPDLERLVNRVVQQIATPRDVVGIRKVLERVPELEVLLAGEEFAPLRVQIDGLRPCEDVVKLIAAAIEDDPPATLGSGGVIRPGFSEEMDRIAEAARDARSWVARLEREERERTGIKNLKVGYNKVFGYYIEVTKANLDRVPEEYIRKQTLVNAERFITPELKEAESLILHAQDRLQELESALFRDVCRRIAASAGKLLGVARALARLDVFASLAEVAVRNRYVRPQLTEEDRIVIRAGRHPVVEQTMRDEPFVPNDVCLDGEERILIITGPNMSGKSTYLRQVALIVLMAQIGSFVPADEAVIGLVDRIFTRIGAQDEISAGQSTFMVEMVETANILHHATPRSLLILDEIGRGTSTYDGISIAWAVVEYIHNHPRLGAKTLFATHYHELTELARVLPRVRNYNVAVTEEEDQVVFLHRIVPGGADRSYGIHVARLAGLPRPVIHRAEEILQGLERDGAQVSVQPRRHEVTQLPLFAMEPHPVVQELRELDVDSMTPLEAITRLYELKRKALDSGKG